MFVKKKMSNFVKDVDVCLIIIFIFIRSGISYRKAVLIRCNTRLHRGKEVVH